MMLCGPWNIDFQGLISLQSENMIFRFILTCLGGEWSWIWCPKGLHSAPWETPFSSLLEPQTLRPSMFRELARFWKVCCFFELRHDFRCFYVGGFPNPWGENAIKSNAFLMTSKVQPLKLDKILYLRSSVGTWILAALKLRKAIKTWCIFTISILQKGLEFETCSRPHKIINMENLVLAYT